MCGVVEDGIIPGYLGYEAGQSAVGDIFAWYVDEAVPAYVKEAAEREGLNVHEWLGDERLRINRARRACWHWTGGTGTVPC